VADEAEWATEEAEAFWREWRRRYAMGRLVWALALACAILGTGLVLTAWSYREDVALYRHLVNAMEARAEVAEERCLPAVSPMR